MTRPRWMVAAVALFVVGIGVALIGVAAWPREAGAPPVAIATPPALPATDADYYRELAPRLRAATAQARELVALGEERSRNLLAISSAQRRMEERLGAVDAIAVAGAPPTRFAAALTTYRDGATAIRRAMAEAEAGFLHFDWDRVARAAVLMRRGADGLEQAVARLEAAAGGAPVATPNRVADWSGFWYRAARIARRGWRSDETGGATRSKEERRWNEHA